MPRYTSVKLINLSGVFVTITVIHVNPDSHTCCIYLQPNDFDTVFLYFKICLGRYLKLKLIQTSVTTVQTPDSCAVL